MVRHVRGPYLLALTLLLFAAEPAFAEVSDKVPSLSWQWGLAAVLVLIALLLVRVRTGLGWVAAILGLLFALAMFQELHSFDVGPAILRELGPDYVTWSYAAAGAGVAGPLLVMLAAWLWRRRSRPFRA